MTVYGPLAYQGSLELIMMTLIIIIIMEMSFYQ